MPGVPSRAFFCHQDLTISFTGISKVIASDRGVPRAQVALAWLVGKPGITAPIVGATKPNHLKDAVAALDLALTNDEVKRLEESYVPHPVVGLSFPNSFEGKISVLPAG
jgi:diketogulonate reductase-like aldo/keto reductase